MMKFPGAISVANINCDESENLVLDYRVEAVPTLILLGGNSAPTYSTLSFDRGVMGSKVENIEKLMEKARAMRLQR